MKNLEIHTAGPSKEFTGTISYTYFESQFGKCLVAATDKGICHVIFFDQLEEALKELRNRWKKAKPVEQETNHQKPMMQYLVDQKPRSKIKLHLHGTDFQHKVWKALMTITSGQTSTYAEVAKKAGHSKAYQAVGGAIGDNPIAYLIPCHRVLKSTGDISGYRWGVERKKAMLWWEAGSKVLVDL